jgi:hypothetical protein
MLKVGRAVFARRCADGDEDDFRRANGPGQVGGKAQTFLGPVAPDHLFQARLVDGHLAAVQGGNLRLVLIDTDDTVAVFGQTATDHEPDIPGSYDSDFHFTIRY